jgi:MFS family permease
MNLFKPYRDLPREVYVIFFSRLINAAGLFVHPLLTLILTVKIGMSISAAGSIIAISGLIFAPASLIGGKITDTIGRKKIIVIFDTLGSLSLLSCAFIPPSMTMVYILLAGMFCWGVAQPAHDALISDVTTPENRTGAFSMSYLGFNLGFVVGPALGGLLFENHLKLFFIIDAMTGLIATLLIIIYIKETIHRTEEDFGEERQDEKHVEGTIFKVLLSKPILLVFGALLFGYNFAYAQWGFLIPAHIEMIKPIGYAAFFGKLSSFNGLVVILFTPLLTSLFDRYGNLDRIILGGVMYTVGFGILGFYNMEWIFILSVFTFTLGEILITISFMPFVANHTPASHRGRMSSILPMIMGLGYAVGPIIMGNVAETYSIEFAWQIIGVVMIVSTVLMGVLNLTERKKHLVKSKAA